MNGFSLEVLRKGEKETRDAKAVYICADSLSAHDCKDD